MKDGNNVMDADLAYAVQIVKSNCQTVEQAAQTCGVDPADLRARLAKVDAERSIKRDKLFESFDR